MIVFNINSNQHISLILFGGMLKSTEKTLIGTYKNGNPHYKLVSTLKYIKGLQLSPKEDWSTKKPGIYSVNEEVLKVLKQDIKAEQLCTALLKYRQLNKELTTYYKSVKNLIYQDNCVHPQFNHVATSTGRLSCKKPNVQNSPASEDTKVPEHFISRFKHGQLISADYKGIEPRIEANLSNDIQKIKDVLNGIDDHTKNLALKENMEYEIVSNLVKTDPEWNKKRKQIKGFTFAQQYGGGDKKIAKTTGFTLEEVREIREARRKEYPTLHQYYELLQDMVHETGQYTDPWGRVYKFTKYPSKNPRYPDPSYSYPEIQNYRTQGFATATIVLSMVGLFWRKHALLNRDKYLIINTIHDSLMLDCKKEFIENAKKDLQILITCAKLSTDLFNYDIKVPIEIDIKIGNSWAEC